MLKFGLMLAFFGRIKIGLVFGFGGCHFIGIGLVLVCHFPENDISSRCLLKKSGTSADLAPYADMVNRVWLLSSPESVVESMASVIKNIFGENRQLTHQNAASELFVRWNGPAVGSADDLLDDVQTKYQNNFVRSSQRSITSSLEGTVVSRMQSEKCHRAVIL